MSSPLMPTMIIQDWQFADTADTIDTTAITIAAAAGSGKRNYMVAIQVTNTDIAVGTVVRVLDGATVIANLFVGPYVAAAPGNSYAEATFPKPLKGSDNTALRYDCVTTSAQVRISAQGFIATA